MSCWLCFLCLDLFVLLTLFSCVLLCSPVPCLLHSPVSWPVCRAGFVFLCLGLCILLTLCSCVLLTLFSCLADCSPVSWPACSADSLILCLGLYALLTLFCFGLHYITRKTSGRASVTGLTEVSYTQTVCMSYSLNTAAATAQTEHPNKVSVLVSDIH